MLLLSAERREVTGVHVAVGVGVLVLCAASAAWGAWAWLRGGQSRTFWRLLRAAQAAILVQLVLGLVLLALGRHPAHLHLLYGVLPAVIMALAEQLKLLSAQTVLDARQLGSAQAVGELPEAEQREVVLAILRRETGVMTAAALVALALALRAAGTAGLFG
jgi:hypothetical protein